MNIIKITHKRYSSVGFSKPQELSHIGVQFPGGQIVYEDEQHCIRVSKDHDELKKALTGVKIESI